MRTEEDIDKEILLLLNEKKQLWKKHAKIAVLALLEDFEQINNLLPSGERLSLRHRKDNCRLTRASIAAW